MEEMARVYGHTQELDLCGRRRQARAGCVTLGAWDSSQGALGYPLSKPLIT